PAPDRADRSEAVAPAAARRQPAGGQRARRDRTGQGRHGRRHVDLAPHDHDRGPHDDQRPARDDVDVALTQPRRVTVAWTTTVSRPGTPSPLPPGGSTTTSKVPRAVERASSTAPSARSWVVVAS